MHDRGIRPTGPLHEPRPEALARATGKARLTHRFSTAGSASAVYAGLPTTARRGYVRVPLPVRLFQPLLVHLVPIAVPRPELPLTLRTVPYIDPFRFGGDDLFAWYGAPLMVRVRALSRECKLAVRFLKYVRHLNGGPQDRALAVTRTRREFVVFTPRPRRPS